MNSHSDSSSLPRKVAISGASGLIGSALSDSLQRKGVTVLKFVRGQKSSGPNEILWNSPDQILEPEKLEGVDAVIHLAARSLVGRWTEKAKREIVSSRVDTTKTMVEAILKLKNPPTVYIGASAIGIYGDRGDETLTESSSSGDDFLAELGVRWEGASAPLAKAGIRILHCRTSLVLTRESVAVKKMLIPFQLGVGAVVGTGEQYVSFITLEDEVRAIEFALKNSNISGPINLAAPNPVTNREFSKALGKAISRPVFLKMPGFVLRLLYGEQAITILSSSRVVPEKLTRAGFTFNHPTIKQAWAYTFAQ